MVRKLINKLLETFKRKSYARHQLDLKLLPFIDYRGGFFIEAGANDGIRQSNTLYFEKHKGWTGLLIEAIPALADQCEKNRPRCIVENCALVSFQYPSESIEMEYYNLMSTIKGGFSNKDDEAQHQEAASKILSESGNNTYLISVPARTLSSVLTTHGINRIDLLSLDVEGYETNVLNGIDFKNHAPKFILVEMRHSEKSAIETILLPDYDQVAILNANNRYSGYSVPP